VKPKTRISDLTRTNEKHLLVNLEYAYFNKQILSADFFLGYFSSERDLYEAQRLVEEAASFLSGFGAFRSRGKGRGKISVEWKDTETVSLETSSLVQPKPEFQYFLETLVNFRNKRLHPGTTQLLDSVKTISSDQLRGWFSRAYFTLHGHWPTPEQLKQIRFSPCYPAKKNEDGTFKQGFPPPSSTVKLEDGAIEDRYGEKPKQDDKDQQENLFKPKARPLPDNLFLTNETPPRIIEVLSEIRMRNSLSDNFVTDENALFAQELIPEGIVFGCTLKIDKTTDEAFAKDAMFIFQNVHPVINGCIFDPKIQDAAETKKNTHVHLLVSGYLPFEQAIMDDPENQVKLTTLARYNTTLKRPRRNRLVFDPGSLVKSGDDDLCTPWNGFTEKEIALPKQIETETDMGGAPPEPEAPVIDDIAKMSRAQIGLLRALLQMEPDAMVSRITALSNKYEKWDEKTIDAHLIPKAVIKKLKILADRNQHKAIRDDILKIMEQHADSVWHDQRPGVIKEFQAKRGKTEV